MKPIGKISSLPANLRDQVNQRLDQSDPPADILQWLNSLPEVQTLLAAKFNGQPISPQNLSEYKLNSFRRWRMRRDALQFASNLRTDLAKLHDLGQGPLSEQLARWVSLRYLSLAHAGTTDPDDDPRAELKRLREVTADILALRRSDRQAQRLRLSQKRFALTRLIARKHHGRLQPKPPRTAEEDIAAIRNMRRHLFGILPEDVEVEDPIATSADDDSDSYSDPTPDGQNSGTENQVPDQSGQPGNDGKIDPPSNH